MHRAVHQDVVRAFTYIVAQLWNARVIISHARSSNQAARTTQANPNLIFDTISREHYYYEWGGLLSG